MTLPSGTVGSSFSVTTESINQADMAADWPLPLAGRVLSVLLPPERLLVSSVTHLTAPRQSQESQQVSFFSKAKKT